MRTFWLRVLRRSAIPLLIIGGMGYAYAEMAIFFLAAQPDANPEQFQQLKWRVPLVICASSLTVMVLFEWLLQRRQRPSDPPRRDISQIVIPPAPLQSSGGLPSEPPTEHPATDSPIGGTAAAASPNSTLSTPPIAAKDETP
ncbi:hypothetical protein [Tuwongella immobilis]|uniref:Uncharacterized protein n=1 Tax=Tuwongella immobilis TaxID=692036 RepID=A0A6C2YW09_9BACT|nr:hypothetical protein [Tuwongella immobilis]VIP05634.1 unnamed protein product [Tuwongella immobilis]VTS08624.1 unnamed protein product [Tuwongella immobilis]